MEISFLRYNDPVCNCFQTNSQYEETYNIALTNRGNDSLLIEVKDNQMSRKVTAMKQTNWAEPPLTGYIAAGISCQSRKKITSPSVRKIESLWAFGHAFLKSIR